jgi:hypothetical protein
MSTREPCGCPPTHDCAGRPDMGMAVISVGRIVSKHVKRIFRDIFALNSCLTFDIITLCQCVIVTHRTNKLT